MRLTWQTLAEGSEIFASTANILAAANILFLESPRCEKFFHSFSRKYTGTGVEDYFTKTRAPSRTIRNHEIFSSFWGDETGALTYSDCAHLYACKVHRGAHTYTGVQMTRIEPRNTNNNCHEEGSERRRYSSFKRPPEVIKARSATILSLFLPLFRLSPIRACAPLPKKAKTSSNSFLLDCNARLNNKYPTSKTDAASH